MNENDGDIRKKFYEKLFAVQSAAVAVEQKGKASDAVGGYDYTRCRDVVFAARKLFIENRLVVIFFVEQEETIKIDRVDHNGQLKGTAFMCKLHLTAEITDVDTGFHMSYQFYGSGYDTTDKGAYKAATGAIKYGYLSLMNIPTGDDPEKDSKGKTTVRDVPPPAGPPLKKARPQTTTHDRDADAGFAKYKGKSWRELEDGYLIWCSNNPEKVDKGQAGRAAMAQAEIDARLADDDEIPPPRDEDSPY